MLLCQINCQQTRCLLVSDELMWLVCVIQGIGLNAFVVWLQWNRVLFCNHAVISVHAALCCVIIFCASICPWAFLLTGLAGHRSVSTPFKTFTWLDIGQRHLFVQDILLVYSVCLSLQLQSLSIANAFYVYYDYVIMYNAVPWNPFLYDRPPVREFHQSHSIPLKES